MKAGDVIEGIGALIISEERIHNISYKIKVCAVPNNHLELRGQLAGSWAAKPALISATFAGRATLELQDGRSVQIVPTHMDLTQQQPSFSFQAFDLS